MTTITVVLLLLTVTVASSLPLANVHVKFVSPPNVYEHSITTDGDRTVAQKSFISIGRRSAPKRSKDSEYNYRTSLRQNHLQVITSSNAESLWPVGVFLPPIDVNDLGYSWQEVHRNLPEEFYKQQRDPYLLTNREAMMAVKYLYGLGELFFDDYPHARALLRNQEERKLNGLHGHVLGSLNPRSPFRRKDRRN
ncbi:uncharacterized protein LOC112467036 [Temnothorax curvispinosus]|uniref:Uncharacterized protein LOC112467036 n=3 Tax=Temnothorax TaxID=300110 RepID=A0A6J1RAJ6_9HYME|nr:uncharacterized protein LOC112467036 [Temnothorax curvispinosus]TGZ54337.1 Uncharacterized protein DBV15_08205 [Temnothorax longispinosus]